MITIICNCFCGEAHRVSNIELEFGNVDDAILIMKSLLLINMKQHTFINYVFVVNLNMWV